jgi:hypothetical protein
MENSKALEGLGEATDLIHLYKGVDEEYFKRGSEQPQDDDTARPDSTTPRMLDESGEKTLRGALEVKLEHLHYEILYFLATIACYFDRGTLARVAGNTVKWYDWEARLPKLSEAHKACWRLMERVDSQDQRKVNKSLEESMEELKSTTKALLDSFTSQSRESEKVLSRVSGINVDHVHSNMRKQLGYHYRDSGQWLRTQFKRWSASETQIFWLCGSGMYIILEDYF